MPPTGEGADGGAGAEALAQRRNEVGVTALATPPPVGAFAQGQVPAIRCTRGGKPRETGPWCGERPHRRFKLAVARVRQPHAAVRGGAIPRAERDARRLSSGSMA